MILILILIFFSQGFRHPVSDHAEYIVETGDQYYDSGGPIENYVNCSNEIDKCVSTARICGKGVVTLTFNKIVLFPAIDGDNLLIYSGTELMYSYNTSLRPEKIISTTRDGCLTIVFIGTSIGSALGWDASFEVIDTSRNIRPFDPIGQEPCNYICRANVAVSIGTDFDSFDLIKNPTLNCEYDLVFFDGNTPIQRTDFNVGNRYVYKVMGGDNHCWGYLTVLE